VAFFFQFFGNFFPYHKAVFADIDLSFFIQGAVVVENIDGGQMVFYAQVVVIDIVPG
jgi:hypothetical protein